MAALRETDEPFQLAHKIWLQLRYWLDNSILAGSTISITVTEKIEEPHLSIHLKLFPSHQPEQMFEILVEAVRLEVKPGLEGLAAIAVASVLADPGQVEELSIGDKHAKLRDDVKRLVGGISVEGGKHQHVDFRVQFNATKDGTMPSWTTEYL